MNTWITSLKGAIALSFLHLMLEVWRAFLDFSFILPGMSGRSIGLLSLYALIYTVVFAVWLIGLSNARAGLRSGVLAALAAGALFWLGMDLATLLYYCPQGCSFPVFDIVTWISLVIGAGALYGLAANLRRLVESIANDRARAAADSADLPES